MVSTKKKGLLLMLIATLAAMCAIFGATQIANAADSSSIPVSKAPHYVDLSGDYPNTPTATIGVRKVLEGDRAVKEGEFEFELWNYNNTDLIATASNDADGFATFTLGGFSLQGNEIANGYGERGYYVKEVVDNSREDIIWDSEASAGKHVVL